MSVPQMNLPRRRAPWAVAPTLVGLALLSGCGSDSNPYRRDSGTAQSTSCGYESQTSCGSSSGTGWTFQCIPDSRCGSLEARSTSYVGTTTCVTTTRNATVAADCSLASMQIDARNGVGVDAGAGPSECDGARDCLACTALSSCGWCAGRCWEGTSTGPNGGSCGATSWAWTRNMCP